MAEVDGEDIDEQMTVEDAIEWQKKLQDRIKLFIRGQLKPFKYSHLKDPKKVLGGEDCCGICIAEFNEEPLEGQDEWLVVRVPQCKHFFHQECLLGWVDTKIDKLEKPDCPSCRKVFSKTTNVEDVEQPELREIEQAANSLKINQIDVAQEIEDQPKP